MRSHVASPELLSPTEPEDALQFDELPQRFQCTDRSAKDRRLRSPDSDATYESFRQPGPTTYWQYVSGPQMLSHMLFGALRVQVVRTFAADGTTVDRESANAQSWVPKAAPAPPPSDSHAPSAEVQCR